MNNSDCYQDCLKQKKTLYSKLLNLCHQLSIPCSNNLSIDTLFELLEIYNSTQSPQIKSRVRVSPLYNQSLPKINKSTDLVFTRHNPSINIKVDPVYVLNKSPNIKNKKIKWESSEPIIMETRKTNNVGLIDKNLNEEIVGFSRID